MAAAGKASHECEREVGAGSRLGSMSSMAAVRSGSTVRAADEAIGSAERGGVAAWVAG